MPLLPPPDLAAVPPRSTGASVQVPLRALSGAKAYRVQLATDANFYALAADVVSAAPLVTVADLPDGTYWLRARGIDPADIEGRDSVMTVVRHVLPAAPVPVTGQAAARRVRRSSTGAVARAAPATGCRWPTTRLSPTWCSSGRTWRPRGHSEALPPGRYYWRVAAIDPDGERGDWSVAQDLTVLRAPPQPEPATLDRHQVQLRWEGHPGERYRVQIARNPAFTRILRDESVSQAELSMKRPRPGTFYARVQIVNADGDRGCVRAGAPVRGPGAPVGEIVLPLLVVSPLLW